MGEWKPQLGRLTLFPAIPLGQVTSALQLFQEFWRREPDSFQKQPGAFAPSMAHGIVDDLTYTCSQSPIRIDFAISPIQPALPGPPSFPLIENSPKLRHELDHLIQVLNENPSVIPTARVALAVQFTQVCRTYREANEAVTSALPEALRVRLSEERDFILQVNRIQDRTPTQDLTMNFITKWSVEQVQILTVTVAPGGPAGITSPTVEFLNATVLCDNNNVQASRMLSKEEQVSTLREALQGAVRQVQSCNLKVEGFF
jgi:hypothetical protein